MTTIAIRNNKINGNTTPIKREEPVCWCKGAYATHMTGLGYRISNSTSCRRPANECFGSHTEKIKKKDFIDKWEKKEKSDFDILKLEQSIISIAKQMKDQTNNMELCKQITNIDNMSFEDIISFWHDFECHYGTIRKNLPWKSQGHSDKTIEKFHYKEEVPSLKISGFNEDELWAFERSLHICDGHFNLIDNKDKCHSIEDICIGGYCCKHGVHSLSQFACLKDMKDGVCDCPSIELIDEEKQKNNVLISELKKQLTSSVDSDGWEIKITPKAKKIIEEQILVYQANNNNLYRKLHYTTEGMIPYNKRLADATKITKPVDLRNIEVKKVIIVKKNHAV